MQPADETTVLGDFEDAHFTQRGVTSRFFKRDGGFFVNTEGPDGALADFEILYTFGIEPLQQYLIEFPGGRLQSLTIAWDTLKRRWFHLYPDEEIPPGDPLHWTGRYQSWNTMCADCHSTELRKGYDPKSDTFETTWAEIDVGCETCHGPGQPHVDWARDIPEGQEPPPGPNGLLTDFRNTDARYQVETCAPCHSRRHRITEEARIARPFLDHFVPLTLREGSYHADGQIQDEVYVYGSFLQSRMYRAGVRCSDCHDSHSLELKSDGNTLCVQCHNEQPNPRFTRLLAKNYDSPEHHFHPETLHPEKPTGTRCVECHMAVRTYMVVDPRRDHSFRVPRPDLSVKLGTPNACNDCHTDKSAEWSVAAVAEWYGPERRQEWHFAEAIAAGRAGAPGAGAALAALAGDATQPGIARATALELLRSQGPEGVAAIVAATQDRDPLVRAAAVGGLDRLAPEQRLATLAPRLADPIRAVRIEAARVLASVPAEFLDPAQRRALAPAIAEFQAAQMAQADMPSAHLNLGVLHASQGQRGRAERAYRTALRMDPAFLPARANLAHLYNQMGRNEDGERVLREGIVHAPEEGELHYSLGLLLAEEERLDEAEESLGRAAELLPRRARVRYNHALALQHLGRNAEAEAALLATRVLDPRDPAIVHALAVLYMQQGKWNAALAQAETLVELAPEAPGAHQLLARIRAHAPGAAGAR
jgi:predicted CXXCH cytochrome family protein